MTEIAKAPARDGNAVTGARCSVLTSNLNTPKSKGCRPQKQASIGGARRLRLVHAQPRPQWPLAVRIAAREGFEPFGLSREFRITRRDLDRLIATACEMEAGR